MTGALVDLFAPPPAGPALPVEYRQGIVITFDRLTLANTIRVGGTDLQDLPILGVGETTMLAAGDVVGILCAGRTWAILGQLVTPGSAAAGDAISLAAANTYTDTVTASHDDATAAWHDLPTPGPTVNSVRIGPSGRCLVFITSAISMLVTAGVGQVSYDVAGATIIDPASAPRVLSYAGAAGTGVTMTCLVNQGGLNPGTHTFTSKYSSTGLGGGGSVRYAQRNLTIMAL